MVKRMTVAEQTQPKPNPHAERLRVKKRIADELPEDFYDVNAHQQRVAKQRAADIYRDACENLPAGFLGNVERLLRQHARWKPGDPIPKIRQGRK